MPDTSHTDPAKKICTLVLLRVSLLTLFTLFPGISAAANADADEPWVIWNSSDNSEPTARHEAGGLAIGKHFYLLGGRGNRPIERLDADANTWKVLANAPMEMHHFQPVEWGGKIYVIGAFTCCYPVETIISHIQIFDPQSKTWTTGSEIPQNRLRGSAAAVVYNNKIYIIGGNTLGHSDGAVKWFDEYDPSTDQWKVMPDAPHARDHFSAAMVGKKLVAAAGRQSKYPEVREHTEPAVDVFDFQSGKWISGYDDIPTERAGTTASSYGQEVIVIGGETTKKDAESTVEALNVTSGKWRSLQPLNVTRHGQGAAVIADYLYVASGNKTRGGGDELTSVERLALDPPGNSDPDQDNDNLDDDDETAIYGTDPTKADTDDDNLKDGDEVQIHKTDPLNKDSDGDGLDDGKEVSNHQTDPLESDSDQDQLTDGEEIQQYETDPLDDDTDDDQLNDGEEIEQHQTDPFKSDTDGDSLSDGEEVQQHNTEPLNDDTDDDSLKDGDEISQHGTDPLNPDTDGDGTNDGEEIEKGTDPLKAEKDNAGGDSNQGTQSGSATQGEDKSSTGSINAMVSLFLLFLGLYRAACIWSGKRRGL